MYLFIIIGIFAFSDRILYTLSFSFLKSEISIFPVALPTLSQSKLVSAFKIMV